MSLGRNLGYINDTNEFNSVYKITKDVSNWDAVCVQVMGPVLGRLIPQATNDGGAQLVTGTGGGPSTAINFMPVQMTDLSTGSSVNAIYGPGLFKLNVAAQYFRLQGSPAAAGTSVYRINLFNSKIS